MQDDEGRRSQIQSVQLWRQMHLQEEGDEKDAGELASCINENVYRFTACNPELILKWFVTKTTSFPYVIWDMRHFGLLQVKTDIFLWIQGTPPPYTPTCWYPLFNAPLSAPPSLCPPLIHIPLFPLSHIRRTLSHHVQK